MTQAAVSVPDEGEATALPADDGDATVDTTPERTLYKHVGSNAIDLTAWPASGQEDSDGDELYYFSGDVNPGDALGASAEWVPTESVGQPAEDSVDADTVPNTEDPDVPAVPSPGASTDDSTLAAPAGGTNTGVLLYVQGNGFDRYFNLPSADGETILRLGPDPVEVDADSVDEIINAAAANGISVQIQG